MSYVESSLTMIKGDSKTFRVSVVDSDGNDVSITGDTVKFTVKINATDEQADAVIAKTSAVSSEIEILSSPDDNKADIKLVPADTESVSPSEYVFDVELTRSATSKVHTIVKGLLTIEQDVTN